MGVLEEVLKNPALLEKVFGFIKGLFNKKPKPDKPVTKPVGGDVDDDFPDDTIPAPPSAKKVKVARVAYKLSRGQFNKKRFPDQYTASNPQGLFDDDYKRQVQNGGSAPYGSKLWFDLTAYDEQNHEIQRDRVIAGKLAYKTEHHIGDAFIIGKGGSPDSPTAGYETNDTDAMGNGISAWLSSLGFLHQVKAHGEGTFECWGSVDGVESNHFTIGVS